jgi:hypothetical protein
MLHQVCSQDRDSSRNKTIDECATIFRHVVILTTTEGVTLGNKVGNVYGCGWLSTGRWVARQGDGRLSREMGG